MCELFGQSVATEKTFVAQPVTQAAAIALFNFLNNQRIC